MFPPARRKRLITVAALVTVISLTAACSGKSGSSSATASGAAAAPKGDILVLTNRTDLVDDGTFAGYATKFKAKYPDVNVKFEGIKDYEGEVRTRMSTADYGDVLAIPNAIAPAQLPDFFEPLGKLTDLESTYRFIKAQSYEGTTYGIPMLANTQGIVYNKKLWTAAGITTAPKSSDEFLKDLQTVKDKNPDTVPLYTNYKDGWPLTQWESNRGEISADPEFNNKMALDDSPWAAGKDHFVIDSLLFDAVNKQLTEADPTTTNWEESKALLGTGKVSAMVLGSWAIVQMQKAAVDAGGAATDIDYMPFPSQKDGKFYAIVGGDYNWAINVNSKVKPAARAWIDWFNNESGFADAQGALSPLKDGPNPATLANFKALDVTFIEENPGQPGKESLLNDIDKASEIGLFNADYRQRIVNAARGASSETKQQIFDDLNSKWKAARAATTK